MSDEFDIADITEEFGEVYFTVKGTKESDGWEKVLKDAQAQFFAAATAELERGTLARKTVDFDIEHYGATNMEKWVEKHYPGWRFVESKKGKFIIEEDPALKAFAYLNPRDSMVYKRSQTQSGPSLDVDRLREEDPDLYQDITIWPADVFDLIYLAMLWVHNPTNDGDLQWAAEETEKFLVDSASHLRQVIDPGTWTPEQTARIKPYLTPGKISVRLTPPRKAKLSELETGEIDE